MKKPYLNRHKDTFGSSGSEGGDSGENDFVMSEEDEKCMRLVPLVVDNEAAPDDLRLFNQRINQCTQLANYYHQEKALKNALQSKIKRIPVPDDLIYSIKIKIGETA